MFSLQVTHIYLINIQQFNKMKVIIKQGLQHYAGQDRVPLVELTKFVKNHHFFTSNMKEMEVVDQLAKALQKKGQLGSRGQSKEQQYKKHQSLQQLGLYLNKDTNNQIFNVFEYILNNPKGLTYEVISKRLKADIITISHYCCKLKKMRLIDWQHEKQGVVVFPKDNYPKKQSSQVVYSINTNQNSFDMNNSLLFRQLTMNENIWINISSAESISKGGFTNEEIKRKIMKHAQNKMVRRTVESMKYFQKTAERQGKVFQFKYKNETEQIKLEIARKEEVQDDQTEIENLNQAVLNWLKDKFPQFRGEYFLRDLINNKFKDYFSSLGVKQSKRQCTPLKLNRYIKVLNYLNSQSGMKECELRNLIVRDQAVFNIGIMHKRSLMGILQGLKNLEILFEDEGYYYPGWISATEWTKRQEVFNKRMKEDDEDHQAPPKKRIHLDQTINGTERKSRKRNSIDNSFPNNTQYVKISQARYRLELFSALLVLQTGKAVQRCYRKSFNRIMYVERKKNVQKFVPQLHVLHVLEDGIELPKLSFNHTLESFYGELDSLVENYGKKQELNSEPQNELMKFIRKNPVKNVNALKIKYGKNWSNKFTALSQQGIVQMDENGLRVASLQRYLI